jgi:hypothetical protein
MAYDGGYIQRSAEQEREDREDGSGDIHHHEGVGEADHFAQLVDLVELRAGQSAEVLKVALGRHTGRRGKSAAR